MKHFSWLGEVKAKAAQAKMDAGRRPVDYGAVPLKSRYLPAQQPAEFTGYGEDGKFQKNMPTEMLQTPMGPRMIHEGEAKVNNPDGTMNIIPQRALARMQQQTGMPGYANGVEGLQTNNIGTVSWGETQNLPKPIDPMIAARGSTGRTPGLPGPTATPALQSDRVAPSQFATTGIGFNQDPSGYAQYNMTKTPEEYAQDYQKRNTVQAPSFQRPALASPPSQLFQAPTASASTTMQTPAIQAPTQIAPQPAAQQFQTPTPAVAPTKPVSMEDVYRNTAMGRLSATARGDWSAVDPAFQKQLDDLKATMDTENQVAAQQAAQQGLSPEIAGARQAMARSGARSSLADAQGQIATAKLAEQSQAATTLASQSLGGQQLEFSKQKYGDEEVSRMEKDIASGASLDTINQGRASRGLAPISNAEYNSIKDAGDLGERDWERNIQAANLLLTTGGPENITKAAAMYNKAFPGMNIVFSELITEENRAEFNTGIAQMMDYVSGNVPFETALALMEKDGTLEMMGLDATQAEKIYRGMKVSAIDAELQDVMNGPYWNGDPELGIPPMTEEQKQAYLILTRAKYTGELEYDVVKQADGSYKLVAKDIATGNSTGTGTGTGSTTTGTGPTWSQNENQNAGTFELEFIEPVYSKDPDAMEQGITQIYKVDSHGTNKPIVYDAQKYLKWREEMPNSARSFDEYAAWYLGYKDVAAYNAGQTKSNATPLSEEVSQAVGYMERGVMPYGVYYENVVSDIQKNTPSTESASIVDIGGVPVLSIPQVSGDPAYWEKNITYNPYSGVFEATPQFQQMTGQFVGGTGASPFIYSAGNLYRLKDAKLRTGGYQTDSPYAYLLGFDKAGKEVRINLTPKDMTYINWKNYYSGS